MKKQLNRYKFEKISGMMAKEFGKIAKGEEDAYTMLFFPMEGNLLKLHRENPDRSGRRAIEAIHVCLLLVDGYLTDTEYDLNGYRTPENEALVNGLLMSFDPFTNDDVRDAVEEDWDLTSPADLRSYFSDPIRCLLRIEKSIELWTEEGGANGYFNYLEQTIGTAVPRNLKMEYTVMIKPQP